VQRNNQFVTPIVIDNLPGEVTARTLQRIGVEPAESGGLKLNERRLQELLHRYPTLLPVRELEPGFSNLVSVCMELPTPAGYVDNLFVTTSGDIVLTECKLWRNPEARREVVAQVIDYAHSMAAWTYEDLNAAIQKGIGSNDAKIASPLVSLATAGGELSEPEFIDAVSRNLRLGRLLLLVVGDGIREGVESLTSYLQVHAGFHFTLGIVEMAIYQLPEDHRLLVQPRVLARTVNIERGIVRLIDGGISVEAVPASGPSGGRRSSISLERFLEALASQDPALPSQVQDLLDSLLERGFETEMFDGLNMKWRDEESGRRFNLGTITKSAEFQTWAVGWKPSEIGRVDLAHEYLRSVAELLGGKVRQTAKPENWYVVTIGTTCPPLRLLLEHAKPWLDLVEKYAQSLSKTLKSLDKG